MISLRFVTDWENIGKSLMPPTKVSTPFGIQSHESFPLLYLWNKETHTMTGHRGNSLMSFFPSSNENCSPAEVIPAGMILIHTTNPGGTCKWFLRILHFWMHADGYSIDVTPHHYPQDLLHIPELLSKTTRHISAVVSPTSGIDFSYISFWNGFLASICDCVGVLCKLRRVQLSSNFRLIA